MTIERHREVRVRGVPKVLIEELNNISKNLGITMSDMLKPKLKEVADSHPEHLKKAPKED